jgi:hypothetical protein
MGAAVGVLALAAGLVIAVKGLPLMVEALAGRRIEAAAHQRDGLTLRRAAAGAGGLAEIGRVLRRLPTAELLALGDRMVMAAAQEEHGAQVLASIAEVVERRDQALLRWARVRERRQEPAAAEGKARGAVPADANAEEAATAAGRAVDAANAAGRAVDAAVAVGRAVDAANAATSTTGEK